MHAKRLLVLLLSAVFAACMLAGCDWLWWLENGDGSSSSSSGSGSSSSSSRPSHDGGSSGGDSRPDPDPDPEPDPDPVLQSISVQNNRSYQVGDAFDQTSLTVTAHYDDQSQRAIEISSCEVSLPDGFDGTFTSAGDYTITVSYTEGEATQTAAVTISVTVDPNDTSTWEVRGQTLMVPRGAQSSQVNKDLLTQHGVTAIDLSESDLAAIEEKAFYSCNLTSIDLGNVTSIGRWAFYNCDKLTYVDLGRVTVIPEYAFSTCDSLSDIDLTHVTSIGYSAFSSCGLTEADLTSVTDLGEYAFWGCFDLTSVKLGGNLTIIKDQVFNACASLSEIDLSHVTSIGDLSFVSCTNLNSVDLSSVTSIGTHAFYTCNNLTDVRLGSRKDRALPTVGTTPFSTLQTVTVYADFSAEEEAACQQTIAGWFISVTPQFKPDSAWQNRASKTASLLRSALPF